MRNTAVPCCILRDMLCEASVKYKLFHRVISFGLQYYPVRNLAGDHFHDKIFIDMVVQMTPYGHQAYACMHAVLRHNELIVPRASYLAQCERSTMCHSCSNSCFAVRAIRIALVFPPRDATKHCVHLSCLLSPAWACIGITSAHLKDHGAFRLLQLPSFTTCTPHHLQQHSGVRTALLLRPAHPVQERLVACQGKSTRVFWDL